MHRMIDLLTVYIIAKGYGPFNKYALVLNRCLVGSSQGQTSK